MHAYKVSKLLINAFLYNDKKKKKSRAKQQVLYKTEDNLLSI